MSSHPRSRDYVEHQGTKGRTKKEILRLLKRAIAREIFRLLTRPVRSTTPLTFGLLGKLKTSPSPSSPTTSASR
jgi:hypothetical protein